MMYQVFMVLLMLLMLAVRRIESLNFCFDASGLEGSRLDSPIFKKIYVSSQIECIISCVQEPCCRSINYRQGLPQSHADLCEMLHDVVYNTSALEKNRFYNYVYFNEPQKEYNNSCIHETEFDLKFPPKNVENYTLLDNNVPEMSNMTLMFWISTLEARKMAVLSYAVEESAEELNVVVNRDKIIIKVHPNKTHFPVPPINDGYWHHVGVTWSLGQYSIYLDGTLVYSGNGLGEAMPLKANGLFAIGQKLTSTSGTFDESKSFSGNLSQVNIWNYDFLSAADVDIQLISQSCSNAVGNIINWSALRERANEMVVKEQARSCKPLRNNPEYDVIIAQLSTAVPSPASSPIFYVGITESLQAVTITMWEKLPNEGHTSYVKYYSSTAGTSLLLSFYLSEDALFLEIAGASKKKARVPMYWKESPAYWHHIATTWSSSTGQWKIYLDGSLVSIMHNVASGNTIPAGGQLEYFLANNNHSLSRLNIWDYEVDGEALSLMASKGPLFENGNVFAWYGVKSKFVDDINYEITPSDLVNTRSLSVYQMNFPEASIKNYAMIKNVFPNSITTFSACFWAKILKTKCGIFTYSTPFHEQELSGRFFYDSGNGLEFAINNVWSHLSSRSSVSTPDSWHFYCMQWRSSDGLTEVYQDAIKLEMKTDDITRHMGYSIPSNGTMVLGQELDGFASGFENHQAFKGSLAALNFWTFFLSVDEIQGMAAGIMNVNGNLLQWRDFRNHTFGDVSIVDRSEAEIPEYRVQALRDKWCKENIDVDFNTSTYARFVRGKDNRYIWRCITPLAMLDENMCYDISKNSEAYYKSLL